MAINFPDSPSVNDTHTVGDKTWTWDGTAWNVVVGGVPTSISELTITNDLTVDTDTLHVDSTNNRVGIGTTSPAEELHILKDQNGDLTQVLIENLDQRVRIGSYYEAGVAQYGKIQSEQDAGGDTALALNPEGGKVGIGTTSPVSQLDMPSVSSTGTTFSSNGWHDGVRLQNSASLRWTKTANKIWAVGQSTDSLYFGNTTSEGTSTPMAYHMVMEPNGQVRTPSNPFFNARLSGSWVYPGTGYTQLNSTAMGSSWTVGNSTGTYSFNTSTGVFTAPVSGVYLYSFSTYMTTGTGGYIHPLLTIDGNPSWNASKTPYTINGYGLNSTYSEGVQVSYTIYLSANQYIYPYFYFHTSSDGIHRDYTYYSVAFLG